MSASLGVIVGLDMLYVHPEVIAFHHDHHLKVAHLTLGSDAMLHIEELNTLGFDVATYGEIDALCDALPEHATSLILLEAPSEVVSFLVAQMRSIFHRACLIAVAEGFNDTLKVNALLMGADACVEASVDSFELTAVLIATTRYWQQQHSDSTPVVRRDGGLDAISQMSATEALSGQWSLIDRGWALVAPCGTTLKLSRHERQLMIRFLGEARGEVVRKADGIARNPRNINAARQLGVTVNRLKRKALARSVILPIRNVRGEGYVFLEDGS